MAKWKKKPLYLLVMALLIGMAAWQTLWPDRARSDMENRPLKQFFAPSAQTVLSGRWMQDMETYVADQFPGRDGWMSLQAISDAALLRVERGGILLGKDGWMFEQCANLSLRTAEDNLRVLGALAASQPAPMTVMLVPMSSATLTHLLPEGYAPDDQARILDDLLALAPDAQPVDVLPALEAAGEAAYFRTDHHWTQAGAYAGYEALAKAWALTPREGIAETVREDGFYGTYFARAPGPFVRGDAFAFDVAKGVRLLIDGEEKPGLYDPVQLADRDKYAALLWGNHGHITLESDALGGTLLVIKDSYANMLLPLLSRHFGRIEAVDLRYYVGDIQTLIEETEAERILCLYGLTTLLTDRSLQLYADAWGG